ncbi:DUF1295 domain-containing protein [Actinomadura barringtoniae]|uniref:DUF1295 domain-containing protein n=1 Tax=Actinomadura barringtoniae TaxID=1427535 RepID=A0A939T5Q7_9ACTN|nr:DUF1295 domain-containing protein [Actinomadura barringtoniae]MBO2450923.1 DUF1295 domain-containing protein [Actinomadura barringtoniae]
MTYLACAVAVVILLATTWTAAVRLGRHSVIDVIWGLGFTVIALVAFVIGDGDTSRRLLVLALTAIWGVRLALHIARRSIGAGEDPRYERMLGRHPDPNTAAITRIYLPQGVVMYFVALPVMVAMGEDGGLGPLAWIGAAVWLVGFAFEAVGDWQLARFRADPDSKGKVLDTGLWRYTRHPNYFGDAVVWWGLFLIAAERWPGVLTLLSPIAMTYFLAGKTGKPLLEKQLTRTRPGYADYVERTSGFFPLPPKKH